MQQRAEQELVTSQTQVQPDATNEHRSAYLKAMRQVPGAVAIIAGEHDGLRGGLAATAWTSVCADPPTMLVCVNQSASAHDLLESAKAFTINLVPVDDAETVAIFSAQRGLNGSDRFLADSWHKGATGQPVLNQACASFECRLIACHTYGTHSVLVGEVAAVNSRPERAGLLYVDGSYARAQKLT